MSRSSREQPSHVPDEVKTNIYQGQAAQLNRAYQANGEPITWRRHPLSPYTSMFYAAAYSLSREIREKKGSETYPSLTPVIGDLGCGAGEKAIKLANLPAHVVALDELEDPLEQARLDSHRYFDATKGGSIEFHKASMLDLAPYGFPKFHGAHDYLAFLHVQRDDWLRYIWSVSDQLHDTTEAREGAPLLIITFDGDNDDFYGYPNSELKNKGIVFSDARYEGQNPEAVAKLNESYFYFPTIEEIRDEFGPYFDFIKIESMPHPLHEESIDHADRHLIHALMRKKAVRGRI